MKRLEEYQINISDEKSVVNFFDEHDILPLTVSVENQRIEQCMEMMMKQIGCAYNYGPSFDQLELNRRKEQADRARKEALASEEQSRLQKAETERRLRSEADWVSTIIIIYYIIIRK